MKKYLLLAATTVLFSTNAMAGTATDDMNISANIELARTIEVTEDIVVGTVVLSEMPSELTKIVDLHYEGCTCSSESCVSVSNTCHAGDIEATNVNLEGSTADATLTIPDTSVGTGLYFKNGSHACHGSCHTQRVIYGELYADDTLTEGSHNGTMTITLSY